jgi:hypothetical protein
MRLRVQLAMLVVGAWLIGGYASAESQPGVTATPAAVPNYTAAGLYDLANTYARAGKPGMAVLNYERARLLAPQDPDIETNLRRVREAAHIAAEQHPWFEPAVRLANPDLISWLGVIGVIILGANLIAGRLQFRYRWLRSGGATFGLLLIGLTAGNASLVWPKLHAAVVILPETPVRVSPVPLGEPLFVLPEAATVAIDAEHEGFVLIRTPEGRTGWISHANIARIVPAS